ncbi:MAG: hypothetical protein ACLQVI_27945 [Polyangiaceae bacterium]|jgi:hypothetical protein
MPGRVVRPSVLAALLALVAALEGRSAAAGEPTTTTPPARDKGHTAAESKGAGPIVVWPTLTPAGDEPSTLPLHRPTTLEPTLSTRAQELDATLRDAVEDLGYALDVADPGPTAGHMRDEDMLARAAKDTWVVSARLEAAGSSSFVLRLVAVPPESRQLRVRVDTVKAEDIAVRGLVMLRDLLAPTSLPPPSSNDDSRCVGCASLENVNTTGLRSPGRAVLAVNGAVFGGYLAYSLQRASNSTDPRVLYPLLALGTGLGVGTGMLVGDEWDLSTGDAWFLAAGAWWGAGAGVLIATGQNAPASNTFAYGVGTGLGGIALATFALTRSRMDEGDALLAHSGGALGLFVGGLIDMAYQGTTNETPYTGAGYGAAIGVVGAGALATVVQVSPSRVILIDTGAALGALAGAAAGSPLVFQNVTETKSRAFVATTLGGTVIGGTLAWVLTKDSKPKANAGNPFLLPGMPTAGVIGASETKTGAVPAYGMGWTGSF